jgi:Leucine-rich repeat (LRR) protein
MNPLLELPIHIKNLEALTVLGIAHSKITELPSQIIYLKNLK